MENDVANPNIEDAWFWRGILALNGTFHDKSTPQAHCIYLPGEPPHEEFGDDR